MLLLLSALVPLSTFAVAVNLAAVGVLVPAVGTAVVVDAGAAVDIFKSRLALLCCWIFAAVLLLDLATVDIATDVCTVAAVGVDF